MKKGFTLVELLGVIIILSLLMLVVFPNVVSIIKNSSSEKDKLSQKLIYDAIETYMNDNKDSYPKKEGNSYCIAVNDLINSNLLKEADISDPLKFVEVTYTDKFNYTLKDKDDCNGQILVEAAEPDLYNGALTPVTYNGTDWIVANPSTEWYDYTKQEWANAVILKSGVTKSAGQTVNVETEVLAMFVWIPRYEYKIDGDYGKGGINLVSPGEIEVNFIPSSQTSPSSSEYHVHPAFTFGSKNLNGIWVGKFETSHTSYSSTSNNLSCTDNNCTNADGLRILPNAQSIKRNNVSNFFYAGLSMTRSGNPFGLNRTTTDSHMMKNSEWGAVAYLSQSKYGKYGNVNFSGAEKEVYINNSSGYYTGRSGGNVGGSVPTVQETFEGQSSTRRYNEYGYYTYDGYKLDYSGVKTETQDILKGTGASTTGNIYGVYDMSGGAYEYVMGYYTPAYTTTPESALPWGSTSSTDYAKFTSEPDKKYYDAYTTTSSTTACSNGICYGHALSETSGWYSDYSVFVSSSYPWFIRGGLYYSGSSAGVFYFSYLDGSNYSDGSFRVVLSSTTGA